MTVFVPNKGKHYLGAASKYGPLKVVFTQNLFPDEIDEKLEAAVRHAETVLDGYDSKTDYLCLVGSPLYMCICIQVLCSINAKVRLLRYDRIEEGYYPIDLPTREELSTWRNQRRNQDQKHPNPQG